MSSDRVISVVLYLNLFVLFSVPLTPPSRDVRACCYSLMPVSVSDPQSAFTRLGGVRARAFSLVFGFRSTVIDCLQV